jgi:Protein of unknown function (DUF5131)
VPGHPFENGFDLTLRPDRLAQPLAWKRPCMIFVNSMSDLFHKEVAKDYISKVFALPSSNRPPASEVGSRKDHHRYFREMQKLTRTGKHGNCAGNVPNSEGGAAPAAPPMTMFCGVARISHMV